MVDIEKGHDCYEHDLEIATMLLISLTIHSFFEGLAFGLMSKVDETLTLGLGIILHKGGEAVALGNKI